MAIEFVPTSPATPCLVCGRPLRDAPAAERTECAWTPQGMLVCGSGAVDKPLKAPPGYKALKLTRRGQWMYVPIKRSAMADACARRLEKAEGVTLGRAKDLSPARDAARRRVMQWLDGARLPIDEIEGGDVLAGCEDLGVMRWGAGPVHVGAIEPSQDDAWSMGVRPAIVARVRHAGNMQTCGAWVREVDAMTSMPVGRPTIYGQLPDDVGGVVRFGVGYPRRGLVLTRDVVSALALHLATGLTTWAVLGAWAGFTLSGKLAGYEGGRDAPVRVVWLCGDYDVTGEAEQENAALAMRLMRALPMGGEGAVQAVPVGMYKEMFAGATTAQGGIVLDREWTDGGQRITWAHFARTLGRDWRTHVALTFEGHDAAVAAIDERWQAGPIVFDPSAQVEPNEVDDGGTTGTRADATSSVGAAGAAGRGGAGLLTPWQEMDEDSMPIIEDAPLTRARRFLWEECRGSDGKRFSLVRWAGEWWIWLGDRYQSVSDELLRSRVWQWLNRFRTLTARGPEPLNPKSDAIVEVMRALAIDCSAHGAELPMWLPATMNDAGLPMWGRATSIEAIAGRLVSRADRPSPASLLVFPNGVLDLASLKPGWGARLAPHSTDLFSSAVLPFDLPIDDLNALLESWEDEHARREIYDRLCPTWMRFTDDISDGDEEYVEQLQAMFGDTISGDRSIEKIFAVGGMQRGGKGVIEEAVALVVGENNVASTSLTLLTERFGLYPLLGKRAAIMPDAHLANFAGQGASLEVLKAISGQGRMYVRDLYKPGMTVKLGVRVWVFYNEAPDLRDDSAAFADRFVILPITKSYIGREDPSIKRNVPREGPGIMLWALEGAIRLAMMEQRRVPLCEASAFETEEFSRISAHVKAFVRDVMQLSSSGIEARRVDPDQVGEGIGATASEIYEAYDWWCSQVEHRKPVGQGKFWRKFWLQIPGGKRHHQPRMEDGSRPRIIVGVTVKESKKQQIALWRAAGKAAGQRAIEYGRDDGDEWRS